MSFGNRRTVYPDEIDNTCGVFNLLAGRIHSWAQRKQFYDPRTICSGNGHVDGSDGPGCPTETCPECGGVGSAINMERLERMLLHINGEVNEVFQLTRDHLLVQLLIHVDGEAKAVPDKHVSHMRAIEVEAADIIIRVLDMCGWLSLDIGEALVAKLAYNDERPIKHGRLH